MTGELALALRVQWWAAQALDQELVLVADGALFGVTVKGPSACGQARHSDSKSRTVSVCSKLEQVCETDCAVFSASWWGQVEQGQVEQAQVPVCQEHRVTMLLLPLKQVPT